MTGLTTKNKPVISGGTYRKNNIISHYDRRYGEHQLTICIAAIGKDKDDEVIVFATDHMVSIYMGEEHGYWKFEHSITKYKNINKNVIAMFAGNPLVVEDLLKDTRNCKTYSDIKDQIFKNFKNLRDNQLKQGFFEILGIDRDFMKENLGKEISNEYIKRILDVYFNFSVGSSILLIGFEEIDNKQQAMIADITEGRSTDFGEMTFHAIGTGSAQAVNTLYFQSHKRDDPVLTTIYDVFKAKKFAEVCEGVGQKTDLGILRIDGKTMIDPKEFEEKGILKSVYDKEMKQARAHKNLKLLKLK